MPILIVLIIITLALYVIYKIKYFRTKRPIEKRWISAKSTIAIGIFVCLFGINQLFLFQESVTYIVSTIFILIGIASVWTGMKAYKYFTPLAIEEAEQYKKLN